MELMAENRTEKKPFWNKKRKGLLIFALAVFGWSFFHVINPAGSWMLVVGPTREITWALHPRTLKTTSGEIYVDLFDHITFRRSGYDVGIVEVDKRGIRNNLIFKGNKINQHLTSVGLIKGNVSDLSFPDGHPQKFVLEGMELEIMQYFIGSEHRHCYLVADFSEIQLSDGTLIKVPRDEPWKGGVFLRDMGNSWELYYWSDAQYFMAKNPQWTTPLRLNSITFEKNRGKVLSYEEVNAERYREYKEDLKAIEEYDRKKVLGEALKID